MEEDEYLGFFVMDEKSTARRLAAYIVNYLETYKIGHEKLIVIGCDGTVLNTGHKVRNFSFPGHLSASFVFW